MTAEHRGHSETRTPSRRQKRFVETVRNAFGHHSGLPMPLPTHNGVSQLIFNTESKLVPDLYVSHSAPREDGSQEFIIANVKQNPKDRSAYNANGIRIRAKTTRTGSGKFEVSEVLSETRVTGTLKRPDGKTIYDAPPPRWEEKPDERVKQRHIATASRNLQKYMEAPSTRFGKRVIQTTAAVTAAAVLLSPVITSMHDGSNQHHDNKPSVSEQTELQYFQIPNAELTAVANILKDSQGLSEIPYNHDLPKPWDTKIGLEAERQIAAADRLGLTVFDYHAAGSELWSDIYEKETPELPFNTYFTTAKDFLAQYGIILSLSTQGDDEQVPLSPDLLEDPNIKRSLTLLIQDFGPLPKELIETLGITEIKLTNVLDTRHGGFARESQIYIDPFAVNASGKLLHEGYHVFDHTHPYQEGQYGFQFLEYNPSFTQENPIQSYGKFYLGDYPPEDYPYISFGHLSTLELNYELAVIRGDQEKATALQNEIQEKEKVVATASDYGFFDDLEDKAEIGMMLLTPEGFQRVLNPDHPILYNKALLLLARFHNEDPRLVQYLADTSIQQNK